MPRLPETHVAPRTCCWPAWRFGSPTATRTAAAPLKQALGAFRDQPPGTVQDVRWPGIVRRIAPDLFHDEAWHDLARRSVQLARDRGALGVLPLALNNLALVRVYEGDLDAAAALVEESDAITDVTGEGRILFGALTLAGFRGDDGSGV